MGPALRELNSRLRVTARDLAYETCPLLHLQWCRGSLSEAEHSTHSTVISEHPGGTRHRGKYGASALIVLGWWEGVGLAPSWS